MKISEFTQVFLEELDEQLQIMDEELLRLERDGASDQAIQCLFRCAHTIKGSSAAMGLEPMKQLTHEMEQLLDGVRSHQITITPLMIDHLFVCLDALRVLKQDFADGTEFSVDIQPLVAQVNALLTGTTKESSPDPGSSSVHSWTMHIEIDLKCELKRARAVLICNQLMELGYLIDVKPALEEETLDDEASRNLVITIHSELEPDVLKSVVNEFVDVIQVELISALNTQANYREDTVPNEKCLDLPVKPVKHKQQTIRVSVERLEHLMNLVGELVIDQTGINQVRDQLNRSFHEHEDVQHLNHISDHITRVIADLQDSVMKVRMLPIEQLFNRFPRMVRDLVHHLNKEVELTLEGSETELDRTLIEEIGDPLIHLIRNAVDHGIEPPEQRIKLGKPKSGRLHIRAAHEDNHVMITIEDDGAGIHPARMKEVGIQKGIITPEDAERMSDQDAIQLIFEPGFSTTSMVSEISGRGVGMDIVRSDIERLNGLIDIHTVLGQGTQFKIRLPLTLAIIRGLLIKLYSRTYIIPMANVVEIVRIKKQDIQSLKGKEIVVIRDRVIPIVWLHDYFHFPRDENNNHLSFVVIGTADKRIALPVDELLGNQDIVIKSLGSYLGKVKCISGSTILGDGRVALILEIQDLFKL